MRIRRLIVPIALLAATSLPATANAAIVPDQIVGTVSDTVSGAGITVEAITPAGMRARLDVTLTDEPPLAQAVVIISALPAEAAPGE